MSARLPGVTGTTIRVVDHDVRPGVQLDMGDSWPQLRRQLIDADIVLMSTPTWMGQHTSVCQRVLRPGPYPHQRQSRRGRHRSTPDAVASTTKLAANAAHVARLLRHEQYPPVTLTARHPAPRHRSLAPSPATPLPEPGRSRPRYLHT